jgi:hypothetical protein
MRKLEIGLLIGAMALVGCTRESPKGGAPGDKKVTTTSKDGTTTTTTTTTKEQTDARDHQFTVKVPSGATNVTQGKQKEVTISLSRGSNFKEPVKIKIEAPAGIKVVPAETTIAADDNNAKVIVEAAADAAVRRHTVTVTGIPETGNSTSVDMDIDVKKKD